MTDPEKWRISDAAMHLAAAQRKAQTLKREAQLAAIHVEHAEEDVTRAQAAFRKACDAIVKL